jgi:SAM-dependent methyltransferase
MLFWPNEWEDGQSDVTEQVKAFYEETPFPNYDDFDSVESLARKAREGGFARMLDEQVPPRVRIIECGCGTAQLSNFLSISNRDVYATDICVNSLRTGKGFADRQGLNRVRFVQQNLFRPVFKSGSFHLVISNGVLHHTSDPKKAFESIASLVAPGGYILVGLYHRYGRLACDFRRVLYRLTGEKFKKLDQEVNRADASDARREAWFNDQYRHPHESKHTIGETLGWFEDAGLAFVNSIPSSRLFNPSAGELQLFSPSLPGGGLERGLAEMLQMFSGGRDNGFFVMLGRRPN